MVSLAWTVPDGTRHVPARGGRANIDRSLVAGLGRDPAATALVTGVIGLAHALGRRTVAEGVETGVQHDTLVALGCDHAQGHLWSPAVPAGHPRPPMGNRALTTP